MITVDCMHALPRFVLVALALNLYASVAAQTPATDPAVEAALSKDGDTMLTPRSRDAYERHLAELNAKYGADKNQALKEAVLAANQAPVKSVPGSASVASVALPADLVPGQKLKVELLPHGADQFLFQDEVYDTQSLEDALANVKRAYLIDQIILLSNEDNAIQIDHLLGLARIGRDLGVTTAYQKGAGLELISSK